VMATAVAATGTGSVEPVSGEAGWAGDVGQVRALDEAGRKYQPLPKLILHTIERLTKEWCDSFVRGDLVTAFGLLTDRTYIVYHSLMPASGVYKGARGLLEYLDHWIRTAHLTDYSYRILFVDEARGESVIESHFSGSFLRNNVTFTDLVSIKRIQWSLGKVRSINIIDQNPQKTFSLFATKGEKSRCKLIESLFKCGACQETMALISDDVVVKFPGFYPTSLLIDLGLQQEMAKGGESLQAGNEGVVTLKGKQGFANFGHLCQKFLFDRIVSGKVLYGDESTVVSMHKLKPNPNQAFVLADSYLDMKMSAVLFTISRYNEQGKAVSVEFLLNRPVMPWDMQHIRAELGAISRAGSLKGNQTA